MLKNQNVIIANWKMNNSFDEAEIWLKSFEEKLKHVNNLPEIVVCPPAILIDYLDELMLDSELEILEKRGQIIDELDDEEIEILTAKIRKINLGGQDCHFEENGAFTGDISAKALSDAGCKYVILGHCERRKYHYESDEIVNKKCQTALKNGLIPVVCIGETLEIREKKQHLEFVRNQILHSIPKSLEIKDLIIAYEPVWSIGTGVVPTIDEIAEMVNFIKGEITKNTEFKISNLKILYGGSTNQNNTAKIMKIDNVSGLLVGGSSLKAEEFAQMCILSY